MAPHSSPPPPRCPTPYECSWQGDPIHDEDPMRFHIETGFGEDEFRAFHAMPRTGCVRHCRRPERSRRIMSTASSSADSEDDDAEDFGELAPRRSTASSPDQQNLPPAQHALRSAVAAADTFPTTRERERDSPPPPPPPRPHPGWLRPPTTSLSGLHRSFPSNEDLCTAGRQSRANSAASANISHHRTHYGPTTQQQRELGRVRAPPQRRQSELERRQLFRRNSMQEAEPETGYGSSDEHDGNNDHDEF